MSIGKAARRAAHLEACGRKRAHATRRAAVVALRGHREHAENPGGLAVYRCLACGLWHLGNSGRRT